MSFRVKLLDFGLARFHSDRPPGGARDPSGVLLGTPNYLAPEQALDFHQADIRSDVYSLGCTLFHLLTGRPPFAGGSLAQKLMRHQEAEPPALLGLCPEAPPALAAAVARMLAKRPEERHQTPAEVAAALAPFARPETAEAVLPESTGVRQPQAERPTRPLPRPKRQTAARPRPPAAEPEPSRRLPTPPSGGRVRAGWVLVGLAALAGLAAAAFRHGPAEGTAAVSAPERPRPLRHARHHGWVGGVAFSPDGRVLASGGQDGMVHLWDVGSEREQAAWRGPPGGILALAYSPDGRRLATGYQDGRVRLWDAAAGRVGHVLAGHRDGVAALAFGPGGRALASGSFDGTARLWPLTADGAPAASPPPAPLRGHTGAVLGVAVLADGGTVATASEDQTVRLWTAGRGAPAPARPAELRGPIGRGLCVAVAPGGRLLAAGGSAAAAQLWDATTGEVRATLRDGHADWVRCLAFAPDGTALFTAGRDGRVVCWDVASGRVRQRWKRPREVCCLAVAPDGRRLAVGEADGRVTILALAAPAARAPAARVSGKPRPGPGR